VGSCLSRLVRFAGLPFHAKFPARLRTQASSTDSLGSFRLKRFRIFRLKSFEVSGDGLEFLRRDFRLRSLDLGLFLSDIWTGQRRNGEPVKKDLQDFLALDIFGRYLLPRPLASVARRKAGSRFRALLGYQFLL